MRSYPARRPTSLRRFCRERHNRLVSELTADGIPVAVTCRVLKLSRQPYYRWLGQPSHRY